MMFECVARMEVNGDTVRLWKTMHNGKAFVGTFSEAYLFALGFGCDQAAELRYMMNGTKTGGMKNAGGN